MAKMGRKSDAVGFAIYLDLLEGLEKSGGSYDVDVLLLCGEASAAQIADKVEELVKSGKSVSTQKKKPEKLRYKELICL